MIRLLHCREYIEKLLKIRDKRGRIVPLVLNAPQARLYDTIRELREQGIPVRVIVLKARQMGFSTVIEAIMFWGTAPRGRHEQPVYNGKTVLRLFAGEVAAHAESVQRP